jgi:hypothetical protein
MLSLNIDIDENEWLNNLPMSGENVVHMKHGKTPPQKKISLLP